MRSAVYVMQNPRCLLHLVAIHEYMSNTGNMAAIWNNQPRLGGLPSGDSEVGNLPPGT